MRAGEVTTVKEASNRTSKVFIFSIKGSEDTYVMSDMLGMVGGMPVESDGDGGWRYPASIVRVFVAMKPGMRIVTVDPMGIAG